MNDFRFACRQLVKNPGFAAVASLTLALGIGANTAIFSVFKAVVIEPFPYPGAQRLVHIWHTPLGQRWRSPLTAPDFLDLRDRNFRVDGDPIGSSAGRRLAAGTFISPQYFRAMGIRLLAGWTLEAGDERVPEQRVVVNRTLAERCWPGQSALGQRIHDDSGRSEWSAEVVGVVESTRQHRPEQPPESEIYWPYAVNPWQGSYLIVRAAGNPKLLARLRLRPARRVNDL